MQHSSMQHSPISIGYEVPLTGTVALAGKQEQEGWNLGLTVFGPGARCPTRPG